MSGRSKRKVNTTQVIDQDKAIISSAQLGAQVMLTAATIVLMETFGWPEEWISEWTFRTMATALTILNDLEPSEEVIEGMREVMGESDELNAWLKRHKRETKKPPESPDKPTELPVL